MEDIFKQNFHLKEYFTKTIFCEKKLIFATHHCFTKEIIFAKENALQQSNFHQGFLRNWILLHKRCSHRKYCMRDTSFRRKRNIHKPQNVVFPQNKFRKKPFANKVFSQKNDVQKEYSSRKVFVPRTVSQQKCYFQKRAFHKNSSFITKDLLSKRNSTRNPCSRSRRKHNRKQNATSKKHLLARKVLPRDLLRKKYFCLQKIMIFL